MRLVYLLLGLLSLALGAIGGSWIWTRPEA